MFEVQTTTAQIIQDTKDEKTPWRSILSAAFKKIHLAYVYDDVLKKNITPIGR